VANQSEPESPSSGIRATPSQPGDRTTQPERGPSRASVILVVVSMVLLAALVWSLNPRRPNFKPAPLNPPSAVCPNPSRPFVPSNTTEIPAPIMNELPADVRVRVIRRLNLEPCKCGCNLSLAACLLSNPNCETALRLFKEIVEEEMKKAREVEGKK